MKASEISEQLRREIQLGYWPDGGELTPETELARRFGASRNTVRNALQQLREDGLVDSAQGKRTIVRNLYRQLPPKRFLWLGHVAESREEPARAPIYHELVKRFNAVGDSLTYWMLAGNDDDRWLLDHLSEYDGIVLADVGASQMLPEFASRLRKYPNTIGTQMRSDSLSRAVCCTDDTRAGELAAEFFLHQNFDKLLLLTVSPGLCDEAFTERERGFVSYLSSHTRGRLDVRMVFSDRAADLHNPGPLLESIRLRENRIQAIFTTTDILAMNCMDALSKIRFRIPEDISILGCDGLPEGAGAPVPLTTLGYAVGKISEHIFEQLRLCAGTGNSPVSRIVAPELIVRKSVRLADEFAAAPLQMIQG